VSLIQRLDMGFLFVPITLVAYVGIPAEKSNMVSGLVNFMRNIGSSVGTSAVTTLIARRAQLHQTVLVNNATPQNPTFLSAVNGLTSYLTQSGLSPDEARRHASAVLYRVAQSQATALAYIDTFWILGITSAIMFALSFLLKKNNPGRDEGAAAV
jgi:DHA2 family multidrug resistance protein